MEQYTFPTVIMEITLSLRIHNHVISIYDEISHSFVDGTLENVRDTSDEWMKEDVFFSTQKNIHNYRLY